MLFFDHLLDIHSVLFFLISILDRRRDREAVRIV
jgi:hypothetical protein